MENRITESTEQIKKALEKPRVVIHGLEGCSKSSMVAKTVYEQLTDPKHFVIFGFKNYALMMEQRIKWIEWFGWQESDIVIVGTYNPNKPKNAKYLSNPTKEGCYNVPRKAKMVFMSQAAVQKSNHSKGRLWIEPMADGTKRQYNRIIIDEFDFTSCLIPRFAYAFTHCLTHTEMKKEPLKAIVDWVNKRYTLTDATNIQHSYKSDKYFTAAWIEDEHMPITYLTSENLACRFLKRIGFDVVELPNDDFKHHVIRLWSSDKIVGSFFDYMNAKCHWNKLGFGWIVSDKIRIDYNKDSLEMVKVGAEMVKVEKTGACSHTAARGSNDFMGQKILTILSHINPEAIPEMGTALRNLGDSEINDKELEGLYYLDRLRQSCSRVIGYRGEYKGVYETTLWAHERIVGLVNGIIEKNQELMPYTFQSYTPTYSFMPDMSECVDKAKRQWKDKKRKERSERRMIVSPDDLNDSFVKDDNSFMWYSEVRDVIKINSIDGISKRPLQPGKVAQYFGVTKEVAYNPITGESGRIIRGIRPLANTTTPVLTKEKL